MGPYFEGLPRFKALEDSKTRARNVTGLRHFFGGLGFRVQGFFLGV